jgi:predicted HTH transcriptional regulator
MKDWLHIQKYGSISRKEYAELVGISPAVAFRDLDEIVKNGILQTLNSGRSRRYIQISNPKNT